MAISIVGYEPIWETMAKKYKLISFDMFQTLVDVNTQKDMVMQAVFGEEYSAEKGDLLWNDANRFVFSYFHRPQNEAQDFATVLSVFEQCYTELFPRYHVKLDPGTGARIVAVAHNKSLFYGDSLPFLEKVQQKYRTCLISDADLLMVEEILSKVRFDQVFLSEKYKAYKFDRLGTLFRAAFREFEIQPHEMLHIGDGYSDVLGAKGAGADAAWINRRGVEWKHEVEPDYTVSSLLELWNAEFGEVL
jgi:putative hydrolase of the HAD superfamily